MFKSNAFSESHRIFDATLKLKKAKGLEPAVLHKESLTSEDRERLTKYFDDVLEASDPIKLSLSLCSLSAGLLSILASSLLLVQTFRAKIAKYEPLLVSSALSDGLTMCPERLESNCCCRNCIPKLTACFNVRELGWSEPTTILARLSCMYMMRQFGNMAAEAVS